MTDPGERGRPGYWVCETSGVLRPVVEAYLRGDPLDGRQCAIMRAYLRQWVAGPWAPSGVLAKLRSECDGLTSREAIRAWLSLAVCEGIDPL